MKILPINPYADIPINLLDDLLNIAVKLKNNKAI